MLNAMGVGALDAPRAERVLRISDTGEPDRPHHVADPEGPRTGRARRGPVRPALARIASTRCPASCGCWPSSTPEIRLGGLRDPSTTNAQALECGATAVAHGAGWPGCPTRSGPPCSGGWPAPSVRCPRPRPARRRRRSTRRSSSRPASWPASTRRSGDVRTTRPRSSWAGPTPREPAPARPGDPVARGLRGGPGRRRRGAALARPAGPLGAPAQDRDRVPAGDQRGRQLAGRAAGGRPSLRGGAGEAERPARRVRAGPPGPARPSPCGAPAPRAGPPTGSATGRADPTRAAGR